jgi:fatty acid desaturase
VRAYCGEVRNARRRQRHQRVVQSVTSAPQSLAEEQSSRIRRYLVTMGIRTACFLGAVLTATAGAPWWVWGTFALLAVVLPYVAVVLANAVRPRRIDAGRPVTPRTDPTHQLGR